jgi:hypothetical protein
VAEGFTLVNANHVQSPHNLLHSPYLVGNRRASGKPRVNRHLSRLPVANVQDRCWETVENWEEQRCCKSV